MDQRLIGTYLSRILSGFYIFFYNSQRYKLIYPDISIKYEAELYADEQYHKNKFNDWINDDDILYTLIDMGVWNHHMEQELDNFTTKIEDAKVDLFKNAINTTKLKYYRKNLSNLNSSYNKLYTIRHSLDHLTPTGYATSLKNQYVLVQSLYDFNNQRLFNDMDNADFNLLNDLSNTITENMISMTTFRLIARSELWRNYWSANKDRLFDKATVNWTDEQKILVVVSKMYDSAYEHPECPADNVIEDDDMFDGWMIAQRRENERQKSKSRTEKMLGNKLSKAGEVFLVANSQEEANNIYGLNDNQSKHVINERQNIILRSGGSDVDVNNLPDVQRDLMSAQNRMFMESRRK